MVVKASWTAWLGCTDHAYPMHTHLPRARLRSDPAECTCGFKIFENRGTLPGLPGSVPATSVSTSGSCVGTGKGNGDRLAEVLWPEIPGRNGIPVASAHAGPGMGGPVHGATGSGCHGYHSSHYGFVVLLSHSNREQRVNDRLLCGLLP